MIAWRVAVRIRTACAAARPSVAPRLAPATCGHVSGRATMQPQTCECLCV